MCYTISMNKHVYNNSHNLFNFLLWLKRTQTIWFASVTLMTKLNYWKHHMSFYSTSSIFLSNTSSAVCHTLVSTRSQWMYYHGSFHRKWGRCFLLILKMPKWIGRIFIPIKSFSWKRMQWTFDLLKAYLCKVTENNIQIKRALPTNAWSILLKILQTLNWKWTTSKFNKFTQFLYTTHSRKCVNGNNKVSK
jgi:hypothetical protein